MKLLASQVFLFLVIETFSQSIYFPDRGSPTRGRNQCPIASSCMAYSMCPSTRRPINGPQCRYNGRYGSRPIGICCRYEVRTPPRPPVVDLDTAATYDNTIPGSRYPNRDPSPRVEQCSRGSRCTAWRACPQARRPRVVTDCYYPGGNRNNPGICCVGVRRTPLSVEIRNPGPPYILAPTTTSTTTTTTTTAIAIAPPSDPRVCGLSRSIAGMMIGAKPAGQGVYPWMVAITTRNSPECTGTLIDRTHVLTAAHCFPRPSQTSHYELRIGNVDQRLGDLYTIRNLAVHEGYRDKQYYYDVAVITLDRPVTSPDFMPICLPGAGFRGYERTGVTLAGWGTTRQSSSSTSDILMELTGVPIVQLSQCDAAFRDDGGNNFVRQFPEGINSGFICAGDGVGRDSCSGDSGGPMMVAEGGRWYEIGILSFGHPRCGTPGFPGVYTRVSSVMNFIRRNL